VNYNTISSLEYQPKTWWAAAIIFYDYDATGKSGSAQGNTITNCQIGIIFKNVNGSAQDNTVSGGTVGLNGILSQPNYAGAYTASFVNNTVSGVTDYSAIDAETYATLTPGHGASLTVTIRNNTLTGGYGAADGVYVGGGAGSVTATISDNIISGWPEHGINLGDSVVAGANITGNTIQNNIGANSGIYVAAAVTCTNVHVNFNNIVGNTGTGVSNVGIGTLDAKNNWWGSASGPGPVGLGTGDEVSLYVDYTPWLHEAYAPAKSLTVVSAYGAPTPPSGTFPFGQSITESVKSPVAGPAETQYVCTGWIGTGSVPASGTDTTVTFTINQNSSITWTWKTQYRVTFTQSGLDSSASGTVVVINGVAKTFGDLPYALWVDSGSSVIYSYNNIVLSSTPGERFSLIGVTGPASPIIVTGWLGLAGGYKIQYQVTLGQTGVGADFTGAVVAVDSFNYGVSGLPAAFWWDQSSIHSFSFASPLVVNSSKKYLWSSTSGLSSVQGEIVTITTSGNVVANYMVQNTITFDQVGVGSDFTGTIIIIDEVSYTRTQLPISFPWNLNSVHTFAFQSPLAVGANAKRYVWTSTTGLSNQQSGSITVTTYGIIVGNYKTQYYLTLATNPPGVNSPSGSGWYDANSTASISTAPLVDIVPGVSRYRFNNWTTGDMTEIANPSVNSATVLMDKAKTVTANYVTQYLVTFNQSGLGSDFAGTVVTIDGVGDTVGMLPASFWWDSGSSHTFSFNSSLVVTANAKQYVWANTTGLSTLRSGSISVSNSGSLTGNYKIQWWFVFSQSGVGPDFSGTVVTINGTGNDRNGNASWWDSGSAITFAYQSPLVVTADVKRFAWNTTAGLSTSQSETITVSSSGSVIGNYETQWKMIFNQTGVGNDFLGAVVTIDSSNYTVSGLPTSFWYYNGSTHTFAYQSPLVVTANQKRYLWNSTSGLSSLQSSTLTVSGSGGVIGNYKLQWYITFAQTDVGSDFSGIMVIIDGTNYTVSVLPVSFWYYNGSSHTFTFQSPLVVTDNVKRYMWNSTSGLSTLQSGSLTSPSFGSILGDYKTQYYLNLATKPPDVAASTGTAWYDAGTYANVSTPQYVIGDSHYIFVNWTTADMSEITNSTAPSTTVFIDHAKNVTANYVRQRLVTFAQTGLAADANRTVVTVNGTTHTYADLPSMVWVDDGSTIDYSYETMVTSTLSGKWFYLDNVTGPSSPITVTADTNVSGNYKIFSSAFTYSPADSYVNMTITFDASASTAGPNATIIQYEWDFGDGSPKASNTTPVTTHVYTFPNNYTVTLNVTNSQGLWGTTSKIITISPPTGPQADFTWNPSTPRANQTVTFDATGSKPGWNGTGHPPIVNYTWDFGDGNITNGYYPTIVHTYATEGNYTVRLDIADASGFRGNITKMVMVQTSLLTGDINRDGIVDIYDALLLARTYGSTPSSPNWNAYADINKDNTVDIFDAILLAANFGRKI
jgi:hypothetical protein